MPLTRSPKECAEHNKPFVAFTNYEKACDSVGTTAVIEALRDREMDEPYTMDCLFQDMTDARAQNSVGGILRSSIQERSETDKVTVSPKLFTACLSGKIRVTNKRKILWSLDICG